MLLKYDDFIDSIKKVIQSVVERYAVTVYNRDTLHLINPSDIHFVINDQLFFEVLLCEIRGACISYSVYHKRKQDRTQINLENAIDILNRRIDHCNNEFVKLELIKNCKALSIELENLRNDKLKGVLMRARACWLQHGEKPSKYFLNLEKRNYTNKLFSSLEAIDGHIVNELDEIKNEVYDYYSNLYESKSCNGCDLNDLFSEFTIDRLSNEAADTFRGPFNIT